MICILNKRLFRFGFLAFAVLVVAVSGHSMFGIAQESSGQSADPVAAAFAKLESVLKQVDGLFYKVNEDDAGKKFATIVWEQEGEISKIVMGLEVLGTYDQKTVLGLSMWTEVARSDSPMAPAVIKAVASNSDLLRLSGYSTSKDFKVVYVNARGTFSEVSPGDIWMYCAYLHGSRLEMKQVIDSAKSSQ